MPTYGRPGAYITEIFAALSPIGAVPGGFVPAIAAAHPRGPLSPVLITSWAQYNQLYGTYKDAPGSILPFAVSEFFANSGSSVYVLRVANTDASDASLVLEDVASDEGGALELTAASPGIWGAKLAVQVDVAQSGFFTLTVYLADSITGVQNMVETFPSLSMNPADNRYCVPVLNSPASGSQYVRVETLLAAYVTGESDLVTTGGPVSLTGGNDGTEAPDLGVMVPEAFAVLPDQILALNLPGVSDVPTLTNMINWAEQMGDKIIVCDGPAPNPAVINQTSYAATVVSNYLSAVQSGSPALPASSYAAIYGPWILSQDPSSSVSRATRWMPPGPAVLAQYQVNDITVGPWQTPAGIKYALNGVLAMEATFSGAQLDTLNLANVNVIKSIPGHGFCIYGGRTLAHGYTSQYLSIRREMMALEHDMENLLQFAVFEPNGPRLWQQITSVLNTYLGQLFQQGVFAGDTANDSFQVVCDASINTPATAQSGLCNINVSVALMSPAEYLQITLTQTTAIAPS